MKVFEDDESLQEHQRKIHNKKCKECDLKFRTMAELEEHELIAHDPFNEDAGDHGMTMRVDENGEFVMEKDLATRQYFAQNSRYKRRKRLLHQMSQIKRTEVVDESKKKSTGHHRFGRKPINAHSFNTRKRNNTLYRAAWTPKETRRFYATLKYSGLNFVYAEAIYNKLVTVKKKEPKEEKLKDEELYIDRQLIKEEGIKNEEDGIKNIRRKPRIKRKRKRKKAKKKKKRNRKKDDSDSDTTRSSSSSSESSSSSDSDSSESEEMEKEWKYRDARALKRKYDQEQRKNYDKITKIVENVKFDMAIVNKVAALAERNKFRLKDEKYYKDSDDDMKPDGDDDKSKIFNPADMDSNDENGDEQKEPVFDPMDREELEEGMEADRERKDLEDQKLAAWRAKEEEEAKQQRLQFAEEIRIFKETQKALKEKKNTREQQLVDDNVVEDVENEEEDEDEDEVEEEEDGDYDMDMNENQDEDDHVGEESGGGGTGSGGFNPFAMMDDDEDGDGNVSDEGVPFGTQYSQGVTQKDDEYDLDLDDEYDDYDEYDDLNINDNPFGD